MTKAPKVTKDAFETFATSDTLATFNVVIGGAGATGVEVAAGLAYLLRNIPQLQTEELQ